MSAPDRRARQAWTDPTCHEDSCHEDLFVERYSSLRDRALRLSGGDRLEADDLLHNAFLQFVLRRRKLSEIENLEAYLFGLLRRLRLSQARSALRRRQEPLLAVDYDTAEMSLPGADHRELLQVKDELQNVCEYACLRKETSKAGSVLILRFFHGFYPKEIAQILRSPLRLANDWLRIARHEARTYLEHPAALRFPLRREPVPPAADILLQLRERIRRARTGECVSAADLRRLYGGEDGGSVDCSTLSHIVSCPECLDLVAKHLALDSSDDRDPRDMLGPDGGWRKNGGGARGQGPPALLRRGASRLRSVLEHRPAELLIAANGLPLGTLKIRSAESDLELAVNIDEPLDFIEVFSEQNVRLLLFEVEPVPFGDVEQTGRVAFGDGRSLDVAVDFAKSWPTVRLVYRDPELTAAVDSAAAPAVIAPARRNDREERWWRGLWRVPLVRPAFGVITLLMAAALWAVLPWQGRSASATELLRGARASEQALLTARNLVVHRVLLLEERRLPARTMVTRRRVDLWQDGARGLTARRVYDEGNRLAAGDWSGTDGSWRLYRSGSAAQVVRTHGPARIDGDNAWMWDPTASHFAELVGSADGSIVEDRGGDYVVRYAAPGNSSTLIAAALTIRKADMRAVAHTLTLRAGGELHEYEFTETALASVPAASVPTQTFEPEPGLIGQPIAADAKTVTPAVEPTRSPAAAPAVLDPDASNHLEMDVLFALHRLEACLVEPSQLTHAANGGLRARARMRDDGCLTQVRGRLSALGRSPALVLDLAAGIVPSLDMPGADDFGVWARARAAAALAEARELEQLLSTWTPDRLGTLDVDRMTMWLDVTRDHARRFRRETQQLREQLEVRFAAGGTANAAQADPIVEIRSVDDAPAAVARLRQLAATYDLAARQMFDTTLTGARIPVDAAALTRSLRDGERQAAAFDEPWTLGSR